MKHLRTTLIIFALLVAGVVCSGCFSRMQSDLTQWEPAPSNLPEISVLPENIHTEYATASHRYTNYRQDMLETLFEAPGDPFIKSSQASCYLEMVLSCAPPTISDIDAPVLASPPWIGMPVRQDSCFDYKVRYRVIDNQGVQITWGQFSRPVEGYSIGWFWGVNDDGAYAIWNSAPALLQRQGRFISRDSARQVVNRIFNSSNAFDEAARQESFFASAQEATPTPNPPSQETEPAQTKSNPASATKRRSHALLIGINEYQHFTPLQNALGDARAIAETLQNEYQFETTLLVDRSATRTNIINALRKLISNLQEGDNVFIYFAGHGVIDDVFDEGYWVPVEARNQSDFISNSEIHKAVEAMEKAQHVLLVADSCFAGKFLTRGEPSRAIAVRKTTNGNDAEFSDYYKKVDRRKSRMVITSGGQEPVMDGGRDGHSVFAYYLLRALLYPDTPIFSGSELATRLQKVVSNNAPQTPNVGFLKSAGHEEGVIVFQKSKP